jgi:hypothetical protein
VARAKRLLVSILHLCFSVLQSDASGKADKPILQTSAPGPAPKPVRLFVSTKQLDLRLEKATLNQCIQGTGGLILRVENCYHMVRGILEGILVAPSLLGRVAVGLPD